MITAIVNFRLPADIDAKALIRRLESDGKEHDVPLRVVDCDPQRIEGRVDDPDVRALRLGAQQTPVR